MVVVGFDVASAATGASAVIQRPPPASRNRRDKSKVDGRPPSLTHLSLQQHGFIRAVVGPHAEASWSHPGVLSTPARSYRSGRSTPCRWQHPQHYCADGTCSRATRWSWWRHPRSAARRCGSPFSLPWCDEVACEVARARFRCALEHCAARSRRRARIRPLTAVDGAAPDRHSERRCVSLRDVICCDAPFSPQVSPELMGFVPTAVPELCVTPAAKDAAPTPYIRPPSVTVRAAPCACLPPVCTCVPQISKSDLPNRFSPPDLFPPLPERPPWPSEAKNHGVKKSSHAALLTTSPTLPALALGSTKPSSGACFTCGRRLDQLLRTQAQVCDAREHAAWPWGRIRDRLGGCASWRPPQRALAEV